MAVDIYYEYESVCVVHNAGALFGNHSNNEVYTNKINIWLIVTPCG